MALWMYLVLEVNALPSKSNGRKRVTIKMCINSNGVCSPLVLSVSALARNLLFLLSTNASSDTAVIINVEFRKLFFSMDYHHLFAIRRSFYCCDWFDMKIETFVRFGKTLNAAATATAIVAAIAFFGIFQNYTIYIGCASSSAIINILRIPIKISPFFLF